MKSSADANYVGELTRNIFVRKSAIKSRSIGLVVLAVFLCSSFQLAYADGNEHHNKKHKKQFVSVNNQIVEVQGAIATLQDQIDSLVVRVNTVEERIIADENAVATLQNQIQALQILASQNLTDIAAIQNEVLVLQGQNTYLQSLIVTNSGNIAAFQAEFDANAALITTLQQAILLVQTNVIDLGTSLQTQIDNNLALIVALQSEIAMINADLAFRDNLLGGTCPNGEAVREIQADGSLVCGPAGGTGGGTIGELQFVQVYELVENVPPGALVNIETACPTGYLTLSNGFYHGLNWNLNRLGVSGEWTSSSAWFAARNDTGMVNYIWHAVTCGKVAAAP